MSVKPTKDPSKRKLLISGKGVKPIRARLRRMWRNINAVAGGLLIKVPVFVTTLATMLEIYEKLTGNSPNWL